MKKAFPLEMPGVIDPVKYDSSECNGGITRDTFDWQVWLPESSTRQKMNFLYQHNCIIVLTRCHKETIMNK